uniref:30S ribosomal protein S14 n=1 Tax=Marophrys sp. SRT127 TaxID=2488311 RepID=A0A455REN0_9EUKA|nr:30S ribosomal protein S14 [Marophrys sp. SRT127]
MRKHIKKDLNRRRRSGTETTTSPPKFESKRIAFKVIQNRPPGVENKQFWASTQLSKLPANASHTRIRNHCVLTGRSRGITHNYFKISRIMLRELAAGGLLPGIKKASW